MVELAHELIGTGHIFTSPRRKQHYADESTFAVQHIRELVECVVPFMDEWLPPSRKREQYEAWREALLMHWQHGARRVRPCTVDGCETPQRAKGVCRQHYFALFGR